MYDYLDVLGEQPLADPLPGGRHLFAALLDALTLDQEPGGDYYRYYPQADDGGYLGELVKAARLELAALPAAAAVAAVAWESAGRCAEAQVLSHAAASRRDDRRARAVGQARSGGHRRWAGRSTSPARRHRCSPCTP